MGIVLLKVPWIVFSLGVFFPGGKKWKKSEVLFVNFVESHWVSLMHMWISTQLKETNHCADFWSSFPPSCSPLPLSALQILTTLTFLNLWYLTPQLSENIRLCSGATTPFHGMKIPSREKSWTRVGSSFFVFLLSKIRVPSWPVAKAWKQLFFVFCPVFCCFWQKNKSKPCYSLMTGGGHTQN